MGGNIIWHFMTPFQILAGQHMSPDQKIVAQCNQWQVNLETIGHLAINGMKEDILFDEISVNLSKKGVQFTISLN